jgi:hypothetical protein
MPKPKTKKSLYSDSIKKPKSKKIAKRIELNLDHKDPEITIEKKEIEPKKQDLKEIDSTKEPVLKTDPSETPKMILAGALTAITVFILIFSTFMFVRLERNQTEQKREVDNLKKSQTNLFNELNRQNLSDPQSEMIQTQDTNFEQPNPVLDKWKGDKRARFVWVQYSDFQCPFCRKIQPDLEKIYQENSDLAMVYRHYPITSIHPNWWRRTVLEISRFIFCLSKTN